jgi:hypothetical protein
MVASASQKVGLGGRPDLCLYQLWSLRKASLGLLAEGLGCVCVCVCVCCCCCCCLPFGFPGFPPKVSAARSTGRLGVLTSTCYFLLLRELSMTLGLRQERSTERAKLHPGIPKNPSTDMTICLPKELTHWDWV